MNIFVGNLSQDATAEDLRNAFKVYGEIIATSILRDKVTNISRGFGFVQMSNETEAKNAIKKLHGTIISGKIINVFKARPREERMCKGEIEMKLTQQLYNEHVEVRKMLQVINKICRNLIKSDTLNQDHFARVLDFLKVFVDLCHHGKEEKSLFPAMEKFGVKNQEGILEHLLKEHNLGRSYVKALREGFDETAKGNKAGTDLIIENGTAFAKLLFHHIEQEDINFFPLAEQVLPEDVKQELLEDFERIEEEVTGPGKHEELEASLLELTKIYQ